MAKTLLTKLLERILGAPGSRVVGYLDGPGVFQDVRSGTRLVGDQVGDQWKCRGTKTLIPIRVVARPRR